MSTITTRDGTQAQLKVVKDAPHGLCTTHKDLVNEELISFIKG